MRGPEEWPSRGSNPTDKIRLTDPAAKFLRRAIGPLSNLPELQKAFQCKAGDAMVRPAEKRCEVW